ncbi:expressed unknown protein [Seminavis robusta]|uniref:RNase H type-1 domain-containing protein n=1 Tax=Seminavis robusta TaxID=568900 RepID=A0A9N8HMG0_9STRA|nr:expressed unknown protein [Seminavis robusta]|eukprot:Sro996_g229290.1 n/a (317) ;mRNA; f:20089-21111
MMTSLERLPPMTKWWLQVVRIVLLLPCCNTAAHILSLQFDGSLRPPSDPGFATASLGRIGTAAAALSLIDHDASGQQKPTNPLWLGGKALPPGGLENSAEAEYEGLLMGLEKAVELVGVSTVVVDKIVVQGDCKTVIDQLKESSRPRKLEAHYIRAQEHLTQLLGEQQGPVVLEYQHIPRKQNQLCDGLCTVIRSRIIEPAAWQRSMAGMDDDQADLSRSLQDLEREDFQVVVQVGEQLEHESKTVWASSAAGKDVAEKLQTWGVALQMHPLQLARTLLKSCKPGVWLCRSKGTEVRPHARVSSWLLQRSGRIGFS